MDYHSYINSQEWRVRRKRALELAKNKCQICGYKYNLEVHHKTYLRLGREYDDDLVVVCNICHEAIQRIMKKDDDLQWKVVTRLSNGWVRVKTQARECRNTAQEMIDFPFVTWIQFRTTLTGL